MDDEFEYVDIQEPVVLTTSLRRRHESGDDMDEDESEEMVAVTDLHRMKEEVRDTLRKMNTEREKNQKEWKQVRSLKRELSNHIETYKQLTQEQRNSKKEVETQFSECRTLCAKMEKEMKSLQSSRVSLEAERTKLEIDREKIKGEMEAWNKDRYAMQEALKSLSSVYETSKRSKSLHETLKRVYDETNKRAVEVAKIEENLKVRALKLKEKEKQKTIQREKGVRLLSLLHGSSSSSSSAANNSKDTSKKSENKDQSSRILLNKTEAYACKECGTHIANEKDIESRCYQVGQGTFNEKKRGYLFAKGFNITFAESKTENFTTGAYNISWVACVKCTTSLGWKYLSSDNSKNTNKVGKFCLARLALTSPQERSS